MTIAPSPKRSPSSNARILPPKNSSPNCIHPPAKARIVGITGSPGAGKSTLVAALAKFYRKEQKRVGIVAVDPTSPFSGGAILGDRIRMAELYTDRGVFIRSMATRGFMGGIARATNDVVDLLDAAGFDIVLVETVGVGQDEVEVIRTVQTNVVVLVPGMGDDIQAIKAGIMEIGDVFVVNKADRPGADKTVTEVTMMMSLVEEHGDWIPPIVKTVAPRGEGIAELDAALQQHLAYIRTSGELQRRNRERVRIRVNTLLKEKFMGRLIGETLTAADYEKILEDVLSKRSNPHDAAEGSPSPCKLSAMIKKKSNSGLQAFLWIFAIVVAVGGFAAFKFGFPMLVDKQADRELLKTPAYRQIAKWEPDAYGEMKRQMIASMQRGDPPAVKQGHVRKIVEGLAKKYMKTSDDMALIDYIKVTADEIRQVADKDSSVAFDMLFNSNANIDITRYIDKATQQHDMDALAEVIRSGVAKEAGIQDDQRAMQLLRA